MSWSDDGIMKEMEPDESLSSLKAMKLGSKLLREVETSVGVVTLLVGGVAQAFHDDQVVELSVLLEVHEKEEEGEDGEGQTEVDSERGELKESRTRTWLT